VVYLVRASSTLGVIGGIGGLLGNGRIGF